MAVWLNVGEIMRVNAVKFADRMAVKGLAVKDGFNELSFREYNEKGCRLANAWLDMGLKKGDRVSVLLYNVMEYMDIYLAAAKAGLVVVPINFRWVGPEIEYVVNDSESKAFILSEEFVEEVDSVKDAFEQVSADRFIFIGDEDKTPQGYLNYEKIISAASPSEPEVRVDPPDTWIHLYTSGTTGRPKGVIRSHESYTAFYLINEVDFGYRPDDIGMIVMPLCHVNSTFYSFVFTYIGGGVYIHRARNYDPEELLQIIEREKITFTSLVPTHYIMMLNLPEEARTKYDLSSVRQLLISSAPARKETKLGIMEMFPNAELFEAYGSTEAGLVTLLKPHEQLIKLGSIGTECAGTDLIKLLDENGNAVPQGEVGELYSRGPMMFDEYWKMPEKTASSFRGEYFSAGDMARQDEEGYYYIVDRKDNMIITGGEKVYPSDVEAVVASHPAVMDVAVIGVPDEKWGESVKAVVIPKDQATAPTEEEIIEFTKGKLAGYRRPKSVDFIKPDEMPRTATGKILHRILRERYL
ncbi:MAG TPA: long-chain fatty acid--CoA ligase [Chloroflexi bacterium]|nr:long-chain fatty acid--CoA ligase [Chloroflexota bacterium]